MARALEAIAKRPTFENKESLGHPAMPEGPPLKIKTGRPTFENKDRWVIQLR
jgi:hypothetical protein